MPSRATRVLASSLLALVGVGACNSSRLGAPALPQGERWIYVATSRGLERANPRGVGLEPFGLDEPTTSVFASPNGKLVAQALDIGYVAVFDAGGRHVTTLDAPATLLGWSDDQTLLFFWRKPDEPIGQLLQADLMGSFRTLTPPQSPPPIAGYTRVLMSQRRQWLAALAVPAVVDLTKKLTPGDQVTMLLSPRDGTLLQTIGTMTSELMAFTGDDRLVIKDGGENLFVKAPSASSAVLIPVPDASAGCELYSWYAPGRALLGRAPTDDHGTCSPAFVVANLTAGQLVSTTQELPPPFALAVSGERAAVATANALAVESLVGQGTSSIGTARGDIVSVGW